MRALAQPISPSSRAAEIAGSGRRPSKSARIGRRSPSTDGGARWWRSRQSATVRSAALWMVPMVAPATPSWRSRTASSSAALRLKVHTSDRSARALPSADRLPTRAVSTVVFPDPAAASTQTTGSSAITASRCAASRLGATAVRGGREVGGTARAPYRWAGTRRWTRSVPTGRPGRVAIVTGEVAQMSLSRRRARPGGGLGAPVVRGRSARRGPGRDGRAPRPRPARLGPDPPGPAGGPRARPGSPPRRDRPGPPGVRGGRPAAGGLGEPAVRGTGGRSASDDGRSGGGPRTLFRRPGRDRAGGPAAGAGRRAGPDRGAPLRLDQAARLALPGGSSAGGVGGGLRRENGRAPAAVRLG